MTTGFRFKQFFVEHSACAMKVGTDGVLLGAWCPIAAPQRIIDVGTGSGLIALMLAQRTKGSIITAIDNDAAAAKQAKQNFGSSPWAERLTARHRSAEEAAREEEGLYDLVVSNPPYFLDSLPNPDKTRNTARHLSREDFKTFVLDCCRLMKSDGSLAMILPPEQAEIASHVLQTAGLLPARICEVFSKPDKALRRVMTSWQREQRTLVREQLILESTDGGRSEAYQALTKDFYL